MILHPAALALLTASAVISLLMIYAAVQAALIVRKWDLESGSETQLVLERRTYLLSSILGYVFGFQLISFFLYIFTADSLCGMFTGAMCAAGTLNVNGFGYPTLLLKMVNFLLAGLWLILNHADTRAYDYPLIRKKYTFLLVMAPLIVTEGFLQWMFLTGLKGDVITSCCGTLFGPSSATIASDLASFPIVPTMVAFYAVMLPTMAVGAYFFVRSRGGYLFAALCAASLVVGVVSIVSFISLYFYELPTHHCPFCLLQSGYGYVGYPLYIALLGGAVLGMGVGMLMPFRNIDSLSAVIPPLQKRLALLAVIFYAVFTSIVTWRIVFTDFRP
jgi:hypothetical protein